jgi:formiminotetrahydrofolate cyclodeaminase
MTNLDDLTIKEFTEELGSESPAPGGGSTAALAGALACSLSSMVAKIARKKTKNESIITKLELIIKQVSKANEEFLTLVNDDTLAFNEILNSFKLPKNTDDDKQKRKDAIQNATKNAAEVPLRTAELGLEIMTVIMNLTKLGSPQTITDLGVAGLMAHSAINGAAWNVKINLGSIKDEEYVTNTNNKLEKILEQMHYIWPDIRDAVEGNL